MKIFQKLMWIMLIGINISAKVSACSCGTITPDMIAGLKDLQPQYIQYNVPPPDIILGVVGNFGNINQYPSAECRVLSVLSGNVSQDTIQLIGDSGVDCFFTVNPMYQTGDTIICVVGQTGLPIHAVSSHYSISFCGFFHARYYHGNVYGGAWGSFTSTGYPYAAFVDTVLQTMAGFYPNNITEIAENHTIYPNPAQNHIHITHEGDDATFILYDIVGKKIVEIALTQQQTQLDVSALPQGAYTYFIERRRILIQKGKLLKVE